MRGRLLLLATVICYLISDGTADVDESKWLRHIAGWLERGVVDLIQIRERELSARRLAELTRKVLLLANPHGAKILVNDRADIAVACGADGVHLRDGSITPGQTRRASRVPFIISLACHSPYKILRGADYILLAPVFAPLSKDLVQEPLGLKAISEAAQRTSVPILALGGITASNAQSCIEAGAAGIAGISLFALEAAG
jgi:thiamine-phosphate pyrophosphorylase